MKVAVLDDYLGVLEDLVDWSVLPEGVELAIFRDHLTGEAAIAERLRDAAVVVAMRERTPFPASLLDRLPELGLLLTLGAANPSIDVARATALGITVAGTGGSGPDPIEMTWALILALARNVAAEDRAVREGQWQLSPGMRLAGATLGVMGLGKIGSRVAAIARAFAMRVLAWSENLDAAHAAGLGVEAVSKADLLARSDIVTLHLRLGARTRGIMGAAELAAMKPGALLVNTARGELIDEAALVRALHDGTIAGAALDVFHREPLPADDPLRSAPNTLLTPHLGGVTAARYRDDYTQCVEDILAWLAGEPLRVLNPEVRASPVLRTPAPASVARPRRDRQG